MTNRFHAHIAATFAILIALPGPASAADTPTLPLVLEAAIALPSTGGRIDHLAIDLARNRLFVAELGNGSVDIVDLAGRRVIRRISGLEEPQGVAFAPKADVLAVASAGDGTVRLYGGDDFAPRGVAKLGSDADNVRVDLRTGNFVVGYGSGGLAIVDPDKATIIRTIPLPGHPEGFQLTDDRAFVNVPDAHEINVADLRSGKVVAKWAAGRLASNFPMALGEGGVIAVGFRSPATLALFDRTSGRIASQAASCGDADDIFFDAKRKRYYVSCGGGAIDVFAAADGPLHRTDRLTTSRGARTSLFVPQLDRLFLAVRAGLLSSSDAAIQIYRPAP